VKLVVASAALAELHDAAAFYTLKANVDLGFAFLTEFERTANFVLENPLLGAVFRGSRRRYILRRFPYSPSIRLLRMSFGFLPSPITGDAPVTGRIGTSEPL
jgi:toxin ParE1/3/4